MIALSAVAPGALADYTGSVFVEAYNTFTFHGSDEVSAAGFGKAEADLQSTGSRTVRSRLQLRALLLNEDGSSTAHFSVPRAEIRWRMKLGENTIRFTAGRTRLTWGDGRLFNAGDVINGTAPAAVDLTDDVLRDETQWMFSSWLPLGQYSFIEPVFLVPVLETGSASSGSGTNRGAGLRIQGKLFNTKTEAGYLYLSDTETHRPCLSLQGHLLLDWYTSVSFYLPDPADEAMDISGGLLYNGTTEGSGTWSIRGEFLRQQKNDSWFLFPEATWSPSKLFTVFTRGTFALRQETETVAAGCTWTPSTGLDISLFCTGYFPSDTITVTAGVASAF